MDEKILKTIKQLLGLPDGYDPFDFELTMHINSVVSTLTQLGVGPVGGLEVSDQTPWSALLLDDAKLQNARSYIFLKVKMLFDSAGMTAHVISAYQKMIDEEAWRLEVAADPMIPQAPIVIPEEVI